MNKIAHIVSFEIVKAGEVVSSVEVKGCDVDTARRRARRTVDRLDNAHGGYVHSVRPVTVMSLSAFGIIER